MKITASVRRLYDDQFAINKLLEARVGELFGTAKEESWFYRGRVKAIESFAQKLETGRAEKPAAMEDFFACTLVVENRTAIRHATELVERFCEVKSRRPPNSDRTHKRPESFVFDDLRLYVKLIPTGRPEPIDDVLFEVQIKTFLQHAWGIATRDLIYKGDSISWAKARVAYQIKAMLEHAEVSIAEVQSIALSDALSMSDDDTLERNRTLKWLAEEWDPEKLPSDRRRLVDILHDLARGLNITVNELIRCVRLETDLGAGMHLQNLSPYGIVLRALFAHKKDEVRRFLTDARFRSKLRLFVTEEMDLGQLPANTLAARCVVLPP